LTDRQMTKGQKTKDLGQMTAKRNDAQQNAPMTAKRNDAQQNAPMTAKRNDAQQMTQGQRSEMTRSK